MKITDLRGTKKESEDIDMRTKRAVDKEVAVLRHIGVQQYCVNFHEDYMEGVLSYIIMERCDVSFLQALERSPELTEKTMTRFIQEMLQALDAIHRNRVVHRDIKPDNFLCNGADFQIKLCDFGLAEILPSSSQTDLKGVYGTAPFMSPEMLSTTGYGALTDIWSLGIIVYVLLFGQFPYQPVESTAKAMKAAILAGVPVPTFKPRESRSKPDLALTKISEDAVTFLRALLERDSRRRPTAERALQLRWMGCPKSSESWSLPSLRPMLYAAKRTGAFDTRGMNENDKSSIDIMLIGLQAKQYKHNLPGISGDKVERSDSEASSSNAPVGLAPALAVQRRKESPQLKAVSCQPRGNQDSNLLTSNASHISTGTGGSAGTYQSKRSRSAAASREGSHDICS